MSFVWSTAIKDWRRHRRDPLGLALWLGSPLVVGLLITLASGGSAGPAPQAHVLVADRDDSFLSGLLVGALSQGAEGGFVRAEAVPEEEGRARMDRGEATALLVIPEGFTRAVLEETPATLELVTNPSERILPGLVEESLSVLVDGVFYVQRLIGEDLREFAQGPPDGAAVFPDERIARFSVEINRLMERLDDRLFPPVIRLETSSGVEEEEEDGPSAALLFLPGLLYIALLFMAQGLAQDLWKERNERTLRRVLVSPQNVPAFLAGKILSGSGLMLVVSGMALAAGYAYFSLDPGSWPLAVLWTTFSGTVLLSLMMVIMLHASSARTAGILTMALVFPLMMVGGSFFPFEIMPKGMAAVGKLTPNGWSLEQLKAILLGRVEPARFAAAFAGLAAVTAALFLWSARRIRAGFAQG